MTELRTEPESSRTLSRRKYAVNGIKRASRRQAAVVGLAVLMGASLLGCHAGPRLFSKKDRDRGSDKRELAEKDKGKFINRKKVRPESEYRAGDDERVAKNDNKSKPKSKSKPADATRKSASDSVERAVANRRSADDAADGSTRAAKSSTSTTKTSKPADRSDVARRDSKKRPVTDLLEDDPLFQDLLPETRTSAKGAESTSASARSTATKSKLMDQDPFKDSVIGQTAARQPEKKKIAPANFLDDDDLNDEDDALEASRLPATKNAVAESTAKAKVTNRQTSATETQSKRKFLDEIDESSNSGFRSLIGEEASTSSLDEPVSPPNPKTVKRTNDAAKTVAGQKVLDRRQNVEQTLNGWRRELDSDGSQAGTEKDAAPVAPPTSARPPAPPAAKGNLNSASIDEFSPPTKSQGAVLNGELIIDTTSLPSRFQRNPASSTEPSNSKGSSGRVNFNSGASIDIVPGASQSRGRSPGQISLQSLSDQDASTGLTTAVYEPSHSPATIANLPSPKLEADSEAGPKLGAFEDDPGIAPGPPEELSDSESKSETSATPTKSRGWKRILLVLAALVSAVGIAFGLRRRMELVPEPIRVPKPPRNDS